MDQGIQKINELLEMACYIIDVLPQKVPKGAKGQFFEVEAYLLGSSKHREFSDRFIDTPQPETIEQAVAEMADHHAGRLNVLFPEEDALLVFDWDCLYLSVYNPPESMQELMKQIAISEGLFWRSAEQ